MTKQTLPTVSLLDENSFTELISLGLPLLVAFEEATGDKSISAFTSAAETLGNEFIFGRTSNLALFEESSLDPPFVVLYNPLDEADRILPGHSNKDKIMRFAESSSDPLIGKFGPDTFAKYTDVSKAPDAIGKTSAKPQSSRKPRWH